MKLLLFDIDGTLVWGNGVGRAAFTDALMTLFSEDAPLRDLLRAKMAEHVFGGKTDWLILTELLEDYTPEQIAALIRQFDPIMGESMAKTVAAGQFTLQPCTAGVETVAALRDRRDIRLGLVTGNVRSSAPIKLRAAGYTPEDFPIGAFGSDAMDRADLPPIALNRAIAHYSESFDPADVIVIGDTLADIACARANGFAVAAVCTGYSPREELEAASPDWLIEDLRALETVIA